MSVRNLTIDLCNVQKCLPRIRLRVKFVGIGSPRWVSDRFVFRTLAAILALPQCKRFIQAMTQVLAAGARLGTHFWQLS